MGVSPEKIVEKIRDRIVAGRLRSGERVPDRKSLARQYGTSLATMQRVVDELVQDGFLVVGARKKGTVVARRLPHLTHYMLLFPERPSDNNLFWNAVQAEAKVLEASNDIRISFFFGLRGHRDIGHYQTVIEDVRRRRVAGLIFALCGDAFDGTPLVDDPSIPRAAIGHAYEFPGVPKVDVDYADFFRKCVQQLIQRGRRRIAMLSPPWGENHDCIRYFLAAIRAHGVEVPAIWRQYGLPNHEDSSRHVIQLMFHKSLPERPDGLIVADDHLVEPASRGLRDAGVRVGETMDMVGLSNFPHPPSSEVPMIRVGFDTRHMLGTVVGYIDQLIAGNKPPGMTYEPAIVENRGDLVSKG